MKKDQIKVGGTYAVKVSGSVQPVRITGESQYGGWDGVNTNTGRKIRIRSAAKCRYDTATYPATSKSVDATPNERGIYNP